jgi:hypothetical protein
METESENVTACLDVLVIKVYRKPTHTGRYLNFNSNHLPHVKRDLIQSLHKELPPHAKNDRFWLKKSAA